MSPLTVQRDGWLTCLQEVHTERGSLMVSNGHEEKLAAEPKRLLLFSQVKVLGHWGADRQNSQWISHHSTQDLSILLHKMRRKAL